MNKCRLLTCSCITLTSFLCGHAGHAQVASQPASFDVDGGMSELATRFKWPEEVRGNVSLMLNCYAVIKSSGRMDKTNCFTKNSFDQAFTVALAKAAKKTQITPAQIDGRAQPVVMQFRVEFNSDALKKERVSKTKEDGEEKSKKEIRVEEKKAEADAVAKANRQIDIHPNPGYEENVKAYGYDHVGGQRVFVGKEPWQEICPKRARFSVWVRAYLSETGEAANPSLEHSAGVLPTANCRNAILETLLASRFTAAMDDGVAVPSTYIEAFGN